MVKYGMGLTELGRNASADNGQKDIEPKPCVFCEIAKGNLPSSRITESKRSLCFLSLEGNPLIAPKVHVGEDVENYPEEVNDTFRLAVRIIPAVKTLYSAGGINIAVNIGKAAGQEINHFHVHLIPRTEGDRKVIFRDLSTISREQLDLLAAQLRSLIPPYSRHRVSKKK